MVCVLDNHYEKIHTAKNTGETSSGIKNELPVEGKTHHVYKGCLDEKKIIASYAEIKEANVLEICKMIRDSPHAYSVLDVKKYLVGLGILGEAHHSYILSKHLPNTYTFTAYGVQYIRWQGKKVRPHPVVMQRLKKYEVLRLAVDPLSQLLNDAHVNISDYGFTDQFDFMASIDDVFTLRRKVP